MYGMSNKADSNHTTIPVPGVNVLDARAFDRLVGLLTYMLEVPRHGPTLSTYTARLLCAASDDREVPDIRNGMELNILPLRV